jgi:uncharacterized membrane protein YdbT with pleckstrin-like domain
MGFIERNLTPGESLIFKTKLHWWILARTIIGLSIILLIISNLGDSSALSCAAPFAILVGIVSFLDYATSEFSITNIRVVMKKGLIVRSTLELNLSQIESISVQETLVGRILGFKTLLLIGSGGTRHPFPFVANANEFKRKLMETIGDTRKSRGSKALGEKRKNETALFDDEY